LGKLFPLKYDVKNLQLSVPEILTLLWEGVGEAFISNKNLFFAQN
jgi:hypothetical protein